MPINLTYVLWAALFSLLLTGSRPTLQLLIGALAIIAGTPLVALERRRAGASPTQPIAAASPAETVAGEAASLQLGAGDRQPSSPAPHGGETAQGDAARTDRRVEPA